MLANKAGILHLLFGTQFSKEKKMVENATGIGNEDFFLFWLPLGISSAEARDQSWAAVMTYATALAMPVP